MHAWLDHEPVHCETVMLISSIIISLILTTTSSALGHMHNYKCKHHASIYIIVQFTTDCKPAFSCLSDVFASCAGTAWVQVLVAV